MKNIVAILLAMIVLALPTSYTKASDESVSALKVWSVALNTFVLDTKENLSQVKVIDKSGQEVNISISLSEINKNIIEVYAEERYMQGSYKLILPKGLKANNGLELQEEFIYEFQVDEKIDNGFEVGIWESTYFYSGPLLKEPKLLDMEAEFYSTNHVKVTIRNEGFAVFRGKYTFDLDEMNMVLNGADFPLQGKLRKYSDKKFKIINPSGKTAYFYKIK